MNKEAMQTNRFIELWQKLSAQNQYGLLKIAYSEKLKFRIYATITNPNAKCGFAISFNNAIKVDLRPINDLRQLSIELIPDSSFENATLLLVMLHNTDNQEVFSTLCENLVHAVVKIDEEEYMVKWVVNKLYEWKVLFEKLSHGVLSRSQQEGLFGELCLLQKMLIKKAENSESAIVETWHSMEPDRAMRDFQGGNWVVEVKTTASNEPQTVVIHGERQLDDSLVENLLLFHCSVDVSNAQGITLPDLIEQIRQLVSQDFIARSLFEEKLYQVGYNSKDEESYRERHYLIRSTKFYKVSDDFPRICENEIRTGVSNVQYAVSLVVCEPFIISNTQAFSIINMI